MSVPHTAVPIQGRTDKFLFRVRKLVRTNNQFLLAFRALRALVHFGPWRGLARALIRLGRPVQADVAASARHPDPFLGGISAEQIVTAVNQNGFCLAGPLPGELVRSLQEMTDSLPVGEYTHAERSCPAVASLVQHEAVLRVLRRYFRSEPALLECSIVIHDVTDPPIVDSQSVYHFDYAGWQSLNMFVYLTEVTKATGPHIVIQGTHRGKSIRDSARPMISTAEAERRFGGQIQTLTGPPGTVIFENTEAFHRRGEVGGRRAIVNALYASHRGAFSHGRGGRSLGKYLAKQGRPGMPTAHD